jgi:hypothetical protein
VSFQGLNTAPDQFHHAINAILADSSDEIAIPPIASA